MGLQVKKLRIGEGVPKICVPVTGVSREEILEQSTSIARSAPDLVEWRCDYYRDILKEGCCLRMLELLSDIFKEIPILFTFRSSMEGGNCEISPEAYEALNLAVADQGIADLIDVEVYRDGLDAKDLLKKIHQRGGKVVASNHHFDTTPSVEDMVKLMKGMENMDGDILKLAVMPQEPKDVLNLLLATSQVSAGTIRPVVTMSMGNLGTLSRISGGTFGSAITFASVGEPSAPGQISLDEMRMIFSLLHK